jgi:hypothetical protein
MQATLKGWVLGGDTYREWAGRTANRRVSPLPRGRPRKVRKRRAATPAGAASECIGCARRCRDGGTRRGHVGACRGGQAGGRLAAGEHPWS